MALASLSVNTLFVLVAVVRLTCDCDCDVVGVLAFWVDAGAVKFPKRLENKSVMPNSLHTLWHSSSNASKACSFGDTPCNFSSFS